MKGAAPVPALILSRVCEEFHCLPSAALEESIDDMLQIIAVRNYAHAKRLVEDPEVDDKALARAGVSEELVEAVFENIGRQRRG